MGALHLALGDRAASPSSLDRSIEEPSRSVELAAVDPILVPLRAEPPFVALVRALGLPERS
jgi:hypothetical protein